jgi:hypothetical protein
MNNKHYNEMTLKEILAMIKKHYAYNLKILFKCIIPIILFLLLSHNIVFASSNDKDIEFAHVYNARFYNINYDSVTKEYLLEIIVIDENKEEGNIYCYSIGKLPYHDFIKCFLYQVYKDSNFRIVLYKREILKIDFIR